METRRPDGIVRQLPGLLRENGDCAIEESGKDEVSRGLKRGFTCRTIFSLMRTIGGRGGERSFKLYRYGTEDLCYLRRIFVEQGEEK